MSAITKTKPRAKAKKPSPRRVSALVDRLAEEFGPKNGERDQGVGAVELLIKLRRGAA